MRVPENIRKCVAYIGYVNQIDNSFGPVGSVFFVGRDKGDGVADPIYAVTAKHVIDGLRKKGVQETIIRLNMKVDDPALGIVRVPIDTWYSHPEDESIDVAIHKMGIPAEVDHQALPISGFMNSELMAQHEISLGDEVFMAGLFRHHVGQGKNIPIIRTGNLAALDDEKVATRHFGDMDAFLIESRSIGGLSGSPVFLNLGFVRSIEGQVKFYNARDPMFFMLGLIHGHYDIKEDQVDDGETLSSQQINTGIAIVTPYYSLLKVMEAFEREKVDHLTPKTGTPELHT
jgi:hypothetical protein